MPNDRWDYLLDAVLEPYKCEACGDNGLIDMSHDDCIVLYYCNYCDKGEHLREIGAYKDIIVG